MGKRKYFKVGEVVEFTFAGSVERGEIVEVRGNTGLSIFDGKYIYPVESSKILKVIK
jgi:hypothetical protein